MPIQITEFSGIVPRSNPERLPDTCAQEAFNCDLSAGSLGPLRVTGDFVSMHNDNLTLKSEVPERDVITIPKPSAPTLNRKEKLAIPGNWCRIFASDWITYINGEGTRVKTRARAQRLSIVNVTYSESELYVTAFLPLRVYTFGYGGPYFLKGPRYQFAFTQADNGPDQNVVFPVTVSDGDPEFVDMRVPLVDENQNIYAYFQVVDVSGPRYDEEILVTDYAYLTWFVPGSYVTFRVNMNYATPRRQHLYYVQTMLTAYEQEGPPSEISDKIVVLPGEKVTLNLPFVKGYNKNRLYRAGTQDAADFRLVDDINGQEYTDWRESTRPDPIPPFGNHPGKRTEFLRGSVLHPNQFGIALYKGTLYPSDQFRFHAWPDEYTIDFPGAKAQALTGNGSLIFCDPEIYLVVGGNPAQLAKYMVSRNHPLLNPAGLCRIGNVVYWPTNDGLAACTGGAVEIITENHFTRKQWQALSPEKMIARTADGSIFLEYASYSDARPFLRFDLKEKLSAVSTYQNLSAGNYRWHSKRFWFDQATIIDFVRVQADGPVTLKVYANRKLVQTLTINSGEAVPLASYARTTSTAKNLVIGVPGSGGGTSQKVTHAREWSFQVEGDAVVRRLEAFERVVHSVENELRLSADTVPLWRSVWVKFVDADRWALMSLSAQTTLPVWVRLWADGNKVFEQRVVAGRALALPRNLPRASLWLIDVESPVRVDELYLTRRRIVDAGDGIRELNDGPFAPWLVKRYTFTDERMLRSVIVHAGKAVNMRLYYDGSIEPSETIAVPDGVETRVTLAQHNSVEFDFNGDDGAVTEVIGFVSRVQTAGQDGVSLVNPVGTRGLLYKFADKGVFACASIGASQYTDLVLTLKADGAEVYSQRVKNGRVFALPHDLPDGTLWEIDIAGGGEINSVLLIPRQPEVLQGRTVYVAHPKTVAPWFYKRYEFSQGATRLISAWVEAEATITLRLYLDGATVPSKLVPLVPRVETLIDLTTDCTRVEFDFAGDDDKIIEIGLFGREVKQADLGGIQESERQNWRKLAYRFVDRAEIACAAVGARSYTGVRLALSADGQQALSVAVADAGIIKLPRRALLASLWEVDVQAPTVGVVDSLVLVPRRAVEAGESVRVARTGSVPRWLYERYEFTGRVRVRSVIVDADRYPVKMRLYYDHSTGISKTISIPNNREVLVDGAPCGSLEFDFDNDGTVRDVTVFPAAEQLTSGAVTLSNPPSWRGLEYKFADRGNWACASVGCTSYPVAVALYADGASVPSSSLSLPDGKVVRFPRDMVKGSRWKIDVQTSGVVESLVLFPWERAPIDGGAIRVLRQESGVPAWFYTTYQVPDQALVGSAIIKADQYPVTLRLFADQYPTAVAEIEVTDGTEIRIPNVGALNELRFDFKGDDYQVTEALLFLKTVAMVQGPVQIGGVSIRRNLYRFATPGAFACGMVTASDGIDGEWQRTYLRLYADGQLVRTERVRGPGVFLLPRSLANATLWEIDVETDRNITDLTLIPWERVAGVGPDIALAVETGQIPLWLYTEYDMGEPWTLRSVQYDGTRDVPIDVYLDGVKSRLMIRNHAETRLLDRISGRVLRFDFGGFDGAVHFVRLFEEDIWPVDGGGIVLRPAIGHPGWRNKLLQFKDTGSWSVGRIVADTYPVVLRLYRGGVPVAEIEATGPDDFKFPRDLPNGKEWGLDISSAGRVLELVLIPRVPYPVNGAVVKIQRADEPFTWLGHRLIADRLMDFSACRIAADAYPVRVRLFGDGIKLVDVLALDGRAFRLPRARPCRQWELDVVAEEGIAIHEAVIGTNMDAVRA